MTPLLFDPSTGGTPPDLPELSHATYARRGGSAEQLSALINPELPSWIVTPAEFDAETPSAVGAIKEPPDHERITPSAAIPAHRPHPLDAPRTVSQGFKLHRMVGRGGMGEVWAAVQGTLQRPVAVKRLRNDVFLPNSEHYARALSDFQLEAMVAGRLEHPNIVPIHDLGADEKGRPLIAMKLVEGETWSDVLAADNKTMSPPDFLAKHLPILLGMANAVAFAHDRGIVHRDLKPSQVMVGSFGEVLLMDWGLAISWRKTDRRDTPAISLSNPSSATSPAGTPAFMAPEQTRDDANGVGPHTDVFLLGGTLYYLLTGSYPYVAATSHGAFLQAREAMQERPEDRSPDRWIPKDLADISMRAMAPLPANRFASAKDFHAAVNDWMTGAAQRREAQALVNEATAALDARPSQYAAFNSILTLLDRARGLWADAPRAQAMRSRALEGYARRALSLGDLTLARAQAENIEPAARRDEVMLDVERAAVLAAKLERQRRWAMRATVALLTAVIVGGALFARSLDAQRQRADAARSDAEGLIYYILGDVREKIAELGRIDVLDGLYERVDQVLGAREASAMSPDDKLGRARLMRYWAEALTEQGRTEEAMTVARKGIDLTTELEDKVDEEDRVHELQTLWMKFALAQSGTADTMAAEDAFLKAIEYAELRRELEGADRRGAARSLMVTLGELSDYYGELNRNQHALEAAGKALVLAQQQTEEQPDDYIAHSDFAQVWARIGHIRRGLTQTKEAMEAHRQAVEHAEIAYRLAPAATDVRSALVQALASAALVMGEVGATDESLKMIERANEINEINLTRSSSLVGDYVMRADLFLMRSRFHHEREETAQARKASDEALQKYATLRQANPENRQWHEKEIAALGFRAELETQSDPAASDKFNAQAIEQARLLVAKTDDAEAKSILGNQLIDHGERLSVRGGRPKESAELLTEGCDILVALATEGPSKTEANFAAGRALVLLGREVGKSDPKKGLPLIEDSIRFTEAAKKVRPGLTSYEYVLATNWFEHAHLLERLGRLDEALESYRRGIDSASRVIAMSPEAFPFKIVLSKSARGHGAVLATLGRKEEALESYKIAAAALGNERPKLNSLLLTWLQESGATHRRIGATLLEFGRIDEAEPHVLKAYDLMHEGFPEGHMGRILSKQTLDSLNRLKAERVDKKPE